MIRKIYADLIRQKVREEGAIWLFKRLRQYFLLHLSARLKRPLCGPALGTLMVTYRCNLHCVMCDMPEKATGFARGGQTEFSTEQFRNIIKEFAQMGTPGIGFTGGEPLLREDIFELMTEVRRHGMISHLNTNGWLLGSEEVERLIDTGVDSVNISLDGATADTHDSIRKTPGAFSKAVRAVETIIRFKHRRKSRLRIKTVAVIDGKNIDEVPQILALGRNLGVDCVELIPRQPFVGNCLKEAVSQELLSKVENLSTFLLEQKKRGVPIENSHSHLKMFQKSFAGDPLPIKCNAGYNSLAVDCYGNIFPCVPWINWGKAVGNLKDGSLSACWNSSKYQDQRKITGECRGCYLNCQTEMNLLFDAVTL